MPDNNPKSQPAKKTSRPKKKMPGHFKGASAGTSLVGGLIADADSVADRSFLGGGGGVAPPSAEAAPPAPGPETPPDITAPAPEPAPAPAPVPVPSPPAPPSVASPPSVTSPASPPNEDRPEVAPNEEPAAPLAKPASARVRGSRPRPHSAVHESFADAKKNPGSWKGHGFRLAPDILQRLKARVQADRKATQNAGLALGHYLDAALRQGPQDVEEQVTLATSFAQERLWDATDRRRTQPSTYRIGEQAYEMVSNLAMALEDIGRGRSGTHVVSAMVEQFLNALDATGPLKPPDRHRK